MLDITPTILDGVLVITPKRHGDDRGFFSETFSQKLLAQAGIQIEFVQDNQSLSMSKGTVRGLHFQAPPHTQDKLVRCGRGSLLDVAVDIRKGSPTFGRWVSEELSFANGKQMLVPAGFLHGFLTLEADTEILYKCSDYYAPECDGAVRFDDPDIGIEWGMDETPAALSAKDDKAPFLKNFDSPFVFEG
ncbi:MAG: dTDP-4-dehydrorhamnose 3,5-epimerase [Candidatus Azotimanducaceae bacterium]|jgi:dTDP-4-dehydrorhamnose 3,5-epimerase